MKLGLEFIFIEGLQHQVNMTATSIICSFNVKLLRHSTDFTARGNSSDYIMGSRNNFINVKFYSR